MVHTFEAPIAYGTHIPLYVAINFHETYKINLDFSSFQLTFKIHFLKTILKKFHITSTKFDLKLSKSNNKELSWHRT